MATSHTFNAPLQGSETEDVDKKRDLPADVEEDNTTRANSLKDDRSSIQEQSGVTRIEALWLRTDIVFGKGWKIWLLWGSLAMVAFVYALSQQTTYTYLQFATSAFGTHAFLGTISVIVSIMSGVAKPFIAKVADLTSRPMALALAVFFYAIGYIVVASAQRATDVAGGEVLYTIGNTGIELLMTIILADITSLQNRGLANGLYASPFILTCWIAGFITEGINAYSADGWRWGYGMFVILVPVCMAPVLVVLFWADRRAKRLGALSLASSSAARRQVLEGSAPSPRRPVLATIIYYWSVIDAFGLLLLGFGFGLILTPFTISATAKGGYSNPSIIAMLCVGGVLLIAFTVWEWTLCPHPIMPRRVLNKSLVCPSTNAVCATLTLQLCSIAIDFGYYFSGYISDTYLSSWIYVIKDWSDRDFNYFQNILTVGLCFFGVIVGLIQRYTHRYKYLQIFGLFTRSLGMGLAYYALKNPADVVLVWSRILVSMGGACSVIGSQLATQASVPHQDMAIAISLLSLWTSIGGSIGSAIAASIWTNKLPGYLEQNLGGVLNSTEIAAIYGDLITARTAEPRDLVIASYNSTMYYLLLPAFILSFLPIIAGFLTTNFYLGDKHNAIEDKVVKLRTEEETDPEVLQRLAWEAEQRVREQVAGAGGRA